jgi:hypothetical protein
MSLLLLLDNPAAVDALRPTVQEVALLERTRTASGDGGEELTFTDSTRPTASEVDALIDQALQAILVELPDGFSAEFYDRARHMVALYTAILIEGSYFREQIDQGSAALYRELLRTGMASLRAAITTIQGPRSIPVTTVVADSPSSSLLLCDLLP